jgi:prolipoprotein diacylglyceryltransferase
MAAITGALMVMGGAAASVATAYLVSLALAMLLGGRLLWLVYQGRRLLQRGSRVVREVGFVSWGALVAALVWPFMFAALTPFTGLWILDRTLIGLLACMAVGRLGCLTYGCCVGVASKIGVRWTDPDAKPVRHLGSAGMERRVPTPLLESAWVLAALAVALLITSTPVPAGVLSGVALLMYAVGRFAIDCLRAEDRFGPWRLTAGQVGALATVVVALVLLFAVAGPPGWEEPAFAVDPMAALLLWPAIATAAGLVFLVTAFHWRRVGSW